MALTRRSFLGWLAGILGVVGLAIAAHFEAVQTRARKGNGRTGGDRDDGGAQPTIAHGLSPEATLFVAAVSARFVPTTDFPGAREANVAEFVSRQMADRNFRVFQDEIEAGAKRHAGFAGLRDAEQDERIAKMQRDDAHLFQVLLTLTLEGMFADPRHGGNRDCAGWKLLGISRTECHPT